MSTIAEDLAAKAAHDEAVRKAEAVRKVQMAPTVAAVDAAAKAASDKVEAAAKKAKADALEAKKAAIDEKAKADKAALDADPDGARPFVGKDVPPAQSHDKAVEPSPDAGPYPHAPSPTPTTPAHVGEAGYPTPDAFRDVRKPKA